MSNKIEVSFERLPKLEVLGVEYPYDVQSDSVLERIQEITQKTSTTLTGYVELYKEFITTVFCGDKRVAEAIEKVYGDRIQGWEDVAVQISGYIATSRFSTVMTQIDTLKRAAARALEKSKK
jgi:hypothetical protein